MSSETSTNQSGIKIHYTEDRKDNNVNPKALLSNKRII